jgi:hypothetical protein
MKLTKKSAIELGKIIAQTLHEQSHAVESLEARIMYCIDAFNFIGDAIESPEARIMYCRSFRAELDRLESLRSAA